MIPENERRSIELLIGKLNDKAELFKSESNVLESPFCTSYTELAVAIGLDFMIYVVEVKKKEEQGDTIQKKRKF